MKTCLIKSICEICDYCMGEHSACCDHSFHPIIRSALKSLIKNDKYLLENELHEQTQTHKLAEYLQDFITEYHVDCEYNKNLKNPKNLDFSEIVDDIRNFIKNNKISPDKNLQDIIKLRSELDSATLIADEDDIVNDSVNSFSYLQVINPVLNKPVIRSIKPDIIVHYRGTKTNKIVIEAKKSTRNNASARLFDLVKLGLLTKKRGQYGYEVGYFIELPADIPDKFIIRFERFLLVPNSNVFIVKVEAFKDSTVGAVNGED